MSHRERDNTSDHKNYSFQATGSVPDLHHDDDQDHVPLETLFQSPDSMLHAQLFILLCAIQCLEEIFPIEFHSQSMPMDSLTCCILLVTFFYT